MRITNLMMTQNAIGYMNDNLERLNSLNEKIASGKQFSTVSDDPARVASALSLRSTLQTNQNYIDNDATVGDWLSANELAFKQMTDIGTRATTLTTQGVSDTMGQEQRDSLANEIDSLLTHAVDIANSQHLDKYIFAGMKTRSTSPPFSINAARTAVVPNDDLNAIKIDISPGQTITTNFIGRDVFNPLFDALVQARIALKSNDATNIQNALSGLQSAMDPLSTARTTNGARTRQLNLTVDTMTKTRDQIKSLLSEKEDVNMAEAISMLRSQETTYQSVLNVSQRSLNMINLFDILK